MNTQTATALSLLQEFIVAAQDVVRCLEAIAQACQAEQAVAK